MNLWLPLVVYFFAQADIPFKNGDEFQVNINLKFKEKPVPSDNSYTASGEKIEKPKGVLTAYLVVDVSDLKILSDEVRIHAVDSRGVTLLKKKTSPLPEMHFEMGFVDDIKNGVTSNEINVLFLSSEKKALRKIVCTVLEDGTFQVNGKWHGKF